MKRGGMRVGMQSPASRVLTSVGVLALFLLPSCGRDAKSIQDSGIPGVRGAAQIGATETGGLAGPGELLKGEDLDEGRWVDSEVKKGDSMACILRREGLAPPEANRVIQALRSHLDFRKIRPGQSFRIHFDGVGELDRFEFQISRVKKVQAVRGADGELATEKIDAVTEVKVHEVGGVIESSLYATIKALGEDTKLVGYLVDIFAYDLNFYIDQHKGDSFRMLLEKEYLDGEFLRYRQVKAAEYRGKAGTFYAFYWKSPDGKRAGYFDDKGRAIAKTFLKTPLKYSRISSKFDRKRMHPVLHRRVPHLGVDYAAPTGTPVRAAASGKITFRGRRGAGGNVVILKHGNKLQTLYLHLSRFRKGQRVGQRVKQKTVIGYVGSTGRSTGPHLHFSVRKHGKLIDPLKMKMTRGPGVPKKLRADFDQVTAKLRARMSQIPVKGAAEPAP